jgi:hypothetical protein
MKTITVVLFLVLSQFGFAQKKCGCTSNDLLSESISCDVTTFKNGAKIYRQFTCDSSWLVFENKQKKIILYSLEEELVALTERLGYVGWTEYKKTFLIENRMISGCCDPSQFILFDKNTGKKIRELGTQIYYDPSPKYPVFITLDGENADYITVLNVENNKTIRYKLPKNRIDLTLRISSELFAEALFDDGEIKNGKFTTSYNYKINEEDDWLKATIAIDLSPILSTKKRIK